MKSWKNAKIIFYILKQIKLLIKELNWYNLLNIEQEQIVMPDSRNTTISRENEILKHQILIVH